MYSRIVLDSAKERVLDLQRVLLLNNDNNKTARFSNYFGARRSETAVVHLPSHQGSQDRPDTLSHQDSLHRLQTTVSPDLCHLIESSRRPPVYVTWLTHQPLVRMTLGCGRNNCEATVLSSSRHIRSWATDRLCSPPVPFRRHLEPDSCAMTASASSALSVVVCWDACKTDRSSRICLIARSDASPASPT